MSYYLLTGATGLLGRYLLRDLLAAGMSLAVVIRPTRRVSARQRVESIMVDWEQSLGRALPRPVVFEGDLTAHDLGLDAPAVAWLREHATAVIHNAASLTFQGNGPDSEPWLSNVKGTRHVLDLARSLDLREFHHVSSSYVCGLRQGTILESELDVGQQLGNDYERSKIQSEQMVRNSEWITDLTVYRPAIIVGDSRTGFTNTFHGFYTPLQIVHSVANRLPAGNLHPEPLLAALGLTGVEHKNFVPVDWVSSVMSYLLTHREHHGSTYHLTPREPVNLRLMCQVMEQAIRNYSIRRDQALPDASRLEGQIETLFREQMQVYRSYWRDDPRFDATNTLRAAPHLPCPPIDRDAIMMLCRYAIEHNFWCSRGESVDPSFDVEGFLDGRLDRLERVPRGNGAVVDLQVNGSGGGQWYLATRDGQPYAFGRGRQADEAERLYMNVRTFSAIVQGELSPARAIDSGRLLVEGGAWAEDDVARLLQRLSTSAG